MFAAVSNVFQVDGYHVLLSGHTDLNYFEAAVNPTYQLLIIRSVCFV